MKKTANFNLKKPDYEDVADIADINANFDIIDKLMQDIKSGSLTEQKARQIFAIINHNHDSNYLGKTSKAVDSDKLDGLDSSEFARIKSAYCNVNGAAIDISNQNLEKVKNKSGLYMGINITGAPDNAWWLIESMVHNVNYINVKATKLATNQTFYGYWNNGSWSNWSKVIDSNIMTLNNKGLQMMYAGADVNSRHIEGTCPGHDGNLFLNYGNRKDVYFPDSDNGNSSLRSIHNVTKLLRNNNGTLEVNIGGVWLSVGAKQYTVVRQGFISGNPNPPNYGINRFDYSGGAGILRLLDSDILYGNTNHHSMGVLVYLDGTQVKGITRSYNHPSPLTPNLEFKNSISIVSVNGTGGSFIVQTEK